MWRAIANDIHGLSTEIAINQPHSLSKSDLISRGWPIMKNILVGLGQKKGARTATLLQNEHMHAEFRNKAECFQCFNPSDNKLALADPKRHFSS
jgi:hypothetical protein